MSFVKNNIKHIVIQVELPVKCSLENFNSIYQEHYKNQITHEYIRKELDLPKGTRLKLNGTFERRLFLLNDNGSLSKVMVKVQTALWYNEKTKTKEYVSIMPSFIKKYCPISLTTLEYIVCNTEEGENIFDCIGDPQCLFDCEDPITKPIECIELDAIKYNYTALLNSRYTEVYNKPLGSIVLDKEEPRVFKVLYELILTARVYFGVKFGVLSRTNKLINI